MISTPEDPTSKSQVVPVTMKRRVSWSSCRLRDGCAQKGERAKKRDLTRRRRTLDLSMEEESRIETLRLQVRAT